MSAKLNTINSEKSSQIHPRIKIVFGVTDFTIGGMQRQLIELLTRLDSTRFDITLITLFTFSERVDIYHQLPPQLAVYRLDFSNFFDVRSWYKLYRLLRRLRPDVVVSSLFFSNTVFRILKFLCGYYAIAREHNTYTSKSIWQRWTDRLLARYTQYIVAVSKTVADFTAKQEHIARDKFVVIHNGVDTTEAQKKLEVYNDVHKLKQELGCDIEDHILLHVARLTQQKNQRELIRGFAEFCHTHPTYRLLIVGDGPMRNELESLATKLGVSSNVHFCGYHEDVWRFYAVADAVVISSEIEGLSNVLLEALAAGVPVITTNTAGADEIVIPYQNGYVIQQSTPQDISDALVQFHEALALSREVIQKSVLPFDIQINVKRYEQLFNSLKLTV
jgi:glycosyltransferase involved in cell wall biosynthesis